VEDLGWQFRWWVEDEKPTREREEGIRGRGGGEGGVLSTTPA
jgi:hypothetical protein